MKTNASNHVPQSNAASRRLHLGIVAAALVAATGAYAQEAKPLSKAEVEAIAVGKNLQYKRTDGSSVTYDVRDNGKVYYSPKTSSRNLVIQGSYTIGDNGALCLKWEADKYVALQDGCYLFKREGTTTHIYARRNPDTPIGDLIE